MALSLLAITVQGAAAAAVHGPADEARVALADIGGAAASRRSEAGSLRAVNSFRYLAVRQPRILRPDAGSEAESTAGRQPRHTPGSWALLIAGLAGVWAIGRRRLSAIADRSSVRYGKWRV